MFARCWSRAGLAVLPVLLVATNAAALRHPGHLGPRPGPLASDVVTAGDPLEPAGSGLVNRVTGAYAMLINQHAGPFPGGAESAARQYLAREAAAFGLASASDDLALQRVDQVPGGAHVRFHQAIRGVPVWAADLVVSLDESGSHVTGVYSAYDPILARAGVSPAAPFAAEAATRVALDALGIRGTPAFLGEPIEPHRLWMLRDEDRAGSPARVAWRISLPVAEPMGDWEVFVDAVSGEVLRITDRMAWVDGSGHTFQPDPLTTAQVAYGTAGYVDGSDADTPQLTAQRVLATLRDLTLTAGVYYLRGPWVYIDEFEAPTSTPVTSTTPSGFAYTRNANGFEDVNVYYLIDTNQRYMQSLGYTTIQHAPIRIDTHGLNGADNSHYIPGSNRIAFGEGGVDDAEDADVVIHEYGHAIQNSIVPGWGTSTQASSMGEGFGDYWACSYSASISSYNDTWVFNWDGHNPFWSGRTVSGTLGYTSLNGDIYHDGDIWASCWWKIRGECGRTVTDNVVLKSFFGLGTGATMPQQAASAMQGDKALYGGLHAGSIDYWMTQRSFWPASQYDVPALTHTPLGDQTGAGPYPVTVTISSTSAITAGSVILKYGTGTAFDQQVTLTPTGNPNEWGGAIPGQGPAGADVRYYIQADNAATWRGATPRGAEFSYHQFHISPATSVDGPAAGLALAPVTPNPVRGAATLRFELPAAADVRLLVYDVHGRVVRTVLSRALEAGRHSYLWNGDDETGASASPGIYFVRLDVAGRTFTQKLLIAR